MQCALLKHKMASTNIACLLANRLPSSVLAPALTLTSPRASALATKCPTLIVLPIQVALATPP